MLFRNKYLVLLLLFISVVVFSQKKIAQEFAIADSLRLNNDFVSSSKKISELIQRSKKEKNELNLVKSYSLNVLVLINQNHFSSGRKYTDSAMYIANTSANPVVKAYANFAEASYFSSINQYDKIVEKANTIIDLLKDNQKEYELLSRTNYLLYFVNLTWENGNPLWYAQEAYRIAKKTTNYNLIINCLMANSIAYHYRYQKSKDEADLKNKLIYLEKAEDILLAHSNRISGLSKATAYFNFAEYLSAEKSTVSRNKAINYLHNVLELQSNLNKEEAVVANAYLYLSDFNIEEKKYEEAKKNLYLAEEVLKSAKVYNYNLLYQVTESMANVYSLLKDYPKAYFYEKEATHYLKESLQNEHVLAAKKMELQFKSDKKDNELNILQLKNKSSQRIIFYGFILFLISIFLLFYINRSNRYRIKFLKEQAKQLENEKNKAELASLLEKEESARLKAEQNLMEIAQLQLKKQNMANELVLEQKKILLADIQSKIQDSKHDEVIKALKNDRFTDSNIEESLQVLKEINPNFFAHLKMKSENKLSAIDLKYCSFFYLNFDTKQISQILNVEPKSVRMARYRIKRKLLLDKSQDLIEYLQSL